MNIYLTDGQYVDLLQRARSNLDTISSAYGFDDTSIGNKSTKTNVGLCNDNLTVDGIRLFRGRRTMKYRGPSHKCPLDKREKHNGSGCFYTCQFFQNGLRDLSIIKHLYDKRIEEVSRDGV